MNLKDSPKLEEICARYVLGIMRGGSRRRFSKYLEQQPFLLKLVLTLGQSWSPNWSFIKQKIGVEPPKESWTRLQSELGLRHGANAHHQTHRPSPSAFEHEGPWFGNIWNRWIGATAFTSSFALLFSQLQPLPIADLQQIGLQTQQALAIRALEHHGKMTLTIYGAAGFGPQVFKAPLTAIAGATQDYELWVIRPGEKTPESFGLLREVYWKKEKMAELHKMIKSSAVLAVSVEPKGGSRNGLPSGGVTVLNAS